VVAIIVDHYLTNGIFPVVVLVLLEGPAIWGIEIRDYRCLILRGGLELARLKTGNETLNQETRDSHHTHGWIMLTIVHITHGWIMLTIVHITHGWIMLTIVVGE